MTSSAKYDAIVVGGGLSGLTSAHKLILANKSVLVLEAADRVGGRTATTSFEDGSYADLGGMWIGPQHSKMHTLVTTFGLELFDQYDTGKTVMILSGNRKTEYSGTIPKLSLLALLDLQLNGINSIEKRARSIPISNPEAHKKSNEWDAMSLETWKQRHMWTAAAKESLDAACRMIFGCEPCEISFLYFLFYVKSNGGLMMLLDIEGGAQEKRIVHGSQQVSEQLVARINGISSSSVLLNTPVVNIDYSQNKMVAVTTADGQKYTSTTVIMACPPALITKNITFTPDLPLSKSAVLQRGFTGCYTKSVIYYKTMFWRDTGYSGSAVCSYNDNAFPVSGVFDYTDKEQNFPALVAFLVAEPALHFATLELIEQEKRIVDSLVNFFGLEAANPTRIVIKEWSKDEWTRGCPVSILPPGTCKNFGTALRAPVGPLFWAGTETASIGCGYMEGAIEAGERAAKEVIDKIDQK
mmetsp:Transcript_20042/g.23073  ORF Transcript_20042/g.23073 Transcript_20042/m.23073 type:complete len:468 (+) Transcript_20042:73-1476(+)|eukprot:CAMPEP_0194392442 /NCGR_PEP_ID=MMETSP0174-20130528/121889_1 /TAXON_ID=216777 /ORGANISM="Proboscia alata, Strain PI-D3" /LENGTH=467 /DNA_ID=CAMNT_0039187841 /DNA_START=1121 /DNA_END=2524 /DNA_ORIENTATION=-